MMAAGLIRKYYLRWYWERGRKYHCAVELLNVFIEGIAILAISSHILCITSKAELFMPVSSVDGTHAIKSVFHRLAF